MNLIIHKYLLNDNQFRLFTIDRYQFESTLQNYEILSASALSSLLLSEDERITFNLKNPNGKSTLIIDAFSNHKATYKINQDMPSNHNRMLFVNKSKLKNFGATYNSIMQFEGLDLLENLNNYYLKSEQLELTFIIQKNHIFLLQPLPSFDDKDYEYLKRYLSNDYVDIKDSEATFMEYINVQVVKSEI